MQEAVKRLLQLYLISFMCQLLRLLKHLIRISGVFLIVATNLWFFYMKSK